MIYQQLIVSSMKILMRSIRCLRPAFAPLFDSHEQRVEKTNRVDLLVFLGLSENILSPLFVLCHWGVALVLCEYRQPLENFLYYVFTQCLVVCLHDVLQQQYGLIFAHGLIILVLYRLLYMSDHLLDHCFVRAAYCATDGLHRIRVLPGIRRVR